MFLPRIIPCLLLHNNGLYKTVQFKNPVYIGDPINAVKIFNDKEVDELIIIDIDATVGGRSIDYERIEDIVSEAFMPVCYGGGVRNIEQMHRLFSLGVEKVSLSSAAIEVEGLVSEAASYFGNQSIVVTIDVKRNWYGLKHNVVTHKAQKKTSWDPISLAKHVEAEGAGEILVNDVDREGTMKGYNCDLMKSIVQAVGIPVIALGGAGSLDDMKTVISTTGASSAAAGSLFVYHGVHRAVLINYPRKEEIEGMFGESV